MSWLNDIHDIFFGGSASEQRESDPPMYQEGDECYTLNGLRAVCEHAYDCGYNTGWRYWFRVYEQEGRQYRLYHYDDLGRWEGHHGERFPMLDLTDGRATA